MRHWGSVMGSKQRRIISRHSRDHSLITKSPYRCMRHTLSASAPVSVTQRASTAQQAQQASMALRTAPLDTHTGQQQRPWTAPGSPSGFAKGIGKRARVRKRREDPRRSGPRSCCSLAHGLPRRPSSAHAMCSPPNITSLACAQLRGHAPFFFLFPIRYQQLARARLVFAARAPEKNPLTPGGHVRECGFNHTDGHHSARCEPGWR